RRDRVRLARQDVALFEAPLGREVQVAAAVCADGAGLLALDVALQPRRVDGLDEELLASFEGQDAFGPFCAVRTVGRKEGPARVARGGWNLSSRPIGLQKRGRFHGLTGQLRAATLRSREPPQTMAPERGPEPA